MHTLSTNPDRPARIVPSYGGIVLQLQKPMQHGDARRFLTNPAVYGLSAPAELFGHMLCLNGRYFVAGPGCHHREEELHIATIAGSVERINRYTKTRAAQLHRCRHPAEALALLWALVVEHYGIPEAEAAEQVAQQQRRDAAEVGLTQAHLANGNDPAINRADDWIPEYPASADEAQPE